MDLATAIEVIRQHEAWRTDDTGYVRRPHSAETVSEALRVAIACMEREMQQEGPPW